MFKTEAKIFESSTASKVVTIILFYAVTPIVLLYGFYKLGKKLFYRRETIL